MFSINSFLSKAAVAAALLFPVQAAAQCVIDKPAYMLYTDEGMPSSFGDMIEAMAQSDVIFFGEYHNSSVVHWLERVVFTSLADRLDNKLTLGMEMFEADTQLKVDEYMAGLISEERFLAETYLWDNYKTDYAPVVKCAKERGIRLIGMHGLCLSGMWMRSENFHRALSYILEKCWSELKLSRSPIRFLQRHRLC